ncbi:hypothetical protein P152DRAFT_452293 [Eremomyces bilateralis CBS 781.70]|uniref:Uncharacterized protein n=1 Tax=Eremomyces bilateralis CBS 781.70 TaxID=1392243 RepID=A0A6G1FTH7_9PEZI|nr:uncharacterized protein P152DRAFT_452293 [Eremomyces bilateralis CBS 781.70]KAF1809185.1 hypothetical protein P152DRAFT_452293 [Eremomyces bilateralis CBS 781.70]
MPYSLLLIRPYWQVTTYFYESCGDFVRNNQKRWCRFAFAILPLAIHVGGSSNIMVVEGRDLSQCQYQRPEDPPETLGPLPVQAPLPCPSRHPMSTHQGLDRETGAVGQGVSGAQVPTVNCTCTKFNCSSAHASSLHIPLRASSVTFPVSCHHPICRIRQPAGTCHLPPGNGSFERECTRSPAPCVNSPLALVQTVPVRTIEIPTGHISFGDCGPHRDSLLSYSCPTSANFG